MATTTILGWRAEGAISAAMRRGAARWRALVAALGLLAAPGVASAQGPPGVVEYYAVDTLGSVRVVFDAAGAVAARSDYLPFGEAIAASGNLPAQRFTGQARDSAEGMDHFNARSLQTRTGRFNTVDPVFAGLFEPQRWNRYAYVENRPLSHIDPTGMMSCKEALAINGNDWICKQQSSTLARTPDGGGYGSLGSSGNTFGGPMGKGQAASGGGGGGGAGRSAGDVLQAAETITVTAEPEPPPQTNPLTDVITIAGPVTNGVGTGAVIGVAAATARPTISGVWNSFMRWMGVASALRPTLERLAYDPRVWRRAAEDPRFHDFPRMLDSQILSGGFIQRTYTGYTQFNIHGQIGSYRGTFEIGGRWVGQTFEVTHRMFRPFPPLR